MSHYVQPDYRHKSKMFFREGFWKLGMIYETYACKLIWDGRGDWGDVPGVSYVLCAESYFVDGLLFCA